MLARGGESAHSSSQFNRVSLEPSHQTRSKGKCFVDDSQGKITPIHDNSIQRNLISTPLSLQLQPLYAFGIGGCRGQKIGSRMPFYKP